MFRPDDLDLRISREFGSPKSPRWNVRVSYADIARKLGIDEETVRLRVKRAQERGFLPSLRLMVNPHLLDCEAVSLELEVDPEAAKAKVISQIKLVDGVTDILDYRGAGLQVMVYSEGGETLSRKVQLLESLCGSPRSALWTSRFPRPSARMRTIDWRLVDALREDARRDLSDVAASAGVSVRTVQRRLQAMKEGKAVYLAGTPNVPAVAGIVCCFVVRCPDPPKKRTVDGVIHSTLRRVGAADTSPEDYSAFGMPCENLAAADQVLGKLKLLDGVEDATMHILNEFIVVQAWLKGEIERRISAHGTPSYPMTATNPKSLTTGRSEVS